MKLASKCQRSTCSERAALDGRDLTFDKRANNIDTQVVEDAISALVNLGYNRSEVFSIVMKIKKEFTLKHESKDFTVGNIIPLALKALTEVNK